MQRTIVLPEPHYIITDVSDWRQRHESKEDAQRWLAGYQVSQTYKDQHYRIVSVEEYWKRRNG